MVKLAIDLMGSDLGSKELLKGVREYLDKNGDVKVVVFGSQEELIDLKGHARVEIVNTTDIVPMEITPLSFLRLKDSSMQQAIKRCALDEDVKGVVSSGSTGGFVTGCQLILKNIKGVIRAGLTAPFPTIDSEKKTVVLDIGASNYNTGEELVCFARLGSLYSKYLFGNPNPSVYLLSNGTEKGKGLKETVEADEILSNENFSGYKGRCEAREVLDGKHDVIVTTGYAGNILLKSIEGTAKMMGASLKNVFKKNFLTKLAYLMVRKGLGRMSQNMDYKKLGGAILLGVNKVAVKSHGNSDAYAFFNALDVAYRMVQSGLIPAIKKEFENEG